MSEAAPLRRIAHLDMDAFFVSVEWLRYPQLKGLPVVVGGGRSTEQQVLERLQREYPGRRWERRDMGEIPLDFFQRLGSYAGRGVVATASYAARQFGVGSAMGLMAAARRCPQAIMLPADFEEYRRCSRAFKNVILEIAPVMEDRGIDEVFIDFTHVPGGQREGGRVLARLIQKTIMERTGLSCSIGVAPNKLLAKMASEFEKPAGISVLWEHELQQRIWPLPCRAINGLGPKTAARLQQAGVETIGQLAACALPWLVEQFGRSYGAWLHDAAWGRDDRPLTTHREPKSMSRETTFARDLHAVRDKAELGAIFTRICEQVASDLQRKGYVGREVGVKLRYADFHIVTRAHLGDEYVQDARRIRALAGQCLKRVDLSQPLRLLGVRVGALRRVGDVATEPPQEAALPLFDGAQ